MHIYIEFKQQQPDSSWNFLIQNRMSHSAPAKILYWFRFPLQWKN